jgi:hypothetical protein
MPNISIYLSVEEFRKLCDFAERQGVKPTKLGRSLIAEGLKSLEASKASKEAPKEEAKGQA